MHNSGGHNRMTLVDHGQGVGQACPMSGNTGANSAPQTQPTRPEAGMLTTSPLPRMTCPGSLARRTDTATPLHHGTGEGRDHVRPENTQLIVARAAAQCNRSDQTDWTSGTGDGLQQRLVLPGGGLQLSTHEIFMSQRAPQYFDALFDRGSSEPLQTLALGSAASAALCISSQLGSFLPDRFQT